MAYIRFRIFRTSGLSILLHGVISLPDATSYDKVFSYNSVSKKHMVMCSLGAPVSATGKRSLVESRKIVVYNFTKIVDLK